ncbi:hypothetical protein ONS95_008901 [Cadophora gregata]|uniref:uncharacterized protein n=1 Tax=Cadophora gregata TaxID=51156 RepID=UPI0026DC1FF3|nr:uncharacterized protein ONS95_008901 [Cadophora gregata]KAK0123909.1 hypothetical protein ONS95_008901 [Cadophora gregata]KAK0130250.1 hypothetical protein ONS96_000773 [Cadophora gregata f. sp. sojae]
MAHQSPELYRHECFIFSPIRPGLGSQKYISYIPQKSLRPRPGYHNAGTFEHFWPSDGRIISKELLVTKRMSMADFMNLMGAVGNEFHSEPVSGIPRISSTERAKKKIEEFDRSIPDPEEMEDTVRVEAEIYLLVVENEFPDELMVQREPTAWSCTVM